MTVADNRREANVRLVDAGFAGASVVSLASVAAALVSQHVFDLQPCPWCILQRLILVVIAAVAALGWLWKRPSARRLSAAAAGVLALGGIAAALWQHFKAAASASCNLTFADRLLTAIHLDTALPSVFEPRASCADAAVKLLGVPYDFWSLALFAALAATAALLLRRSWSIGR